MNYSVTILLACAMIACTMAAAPDSISISVDKPWVTAGSGDISSITVEVKNTSCDCPVSSQEVIISCRDGCDNGTMGTLRQYATFTDSNGIVRGSFTPKTRSGGVTICANVSGVPALGDCTVIGVDHAAPSRWSMLEYPVSVPVHTTASITVRMSDTYGNIVDNRRAIEYVTFRAAELNTNGFWDGSRYVSSIQVPVGADGDATAIYRTDTNAGVNYIAITGPTRDLDRWISINGMATSPAQIASELEPGPQIRANGEDALLITYRVTDTYGNPVPNVAILVNTSLGEGNRFITSSRGTVVLTYGPKRSIGFIEITASVEDHPEINVTDTVEFVSTEPVMWVLTANPQTLASRDVREDITAEIRAKVMDRLGNPVADETVEFSIEKVDNNTPFVSEPMLESTSAKTDRDGFAIVRLRPGAFPKPDEDGYNEMARGTARIVARWKNMTQYIEITFMNYPYLRVETQVSPPTVNLNEPFDVTIRLIGDGWALRPKPIDVMLVFDRSGSMSSIVEGSERRIDQAQRAAKTFVAQFDQNRDRVGLVYFNDRAVLGQGLSSNFQSVNTTIDSLAPSGWTNMRNATYTALREVEASGRSGTVRAIVLMTDGEWNYGGSPLATGAGYANMSDAWFRTIINDDLNDDYKWYMGLGGNLTGSPTNRICYDGINTGQNMSVYAKNNDIRIYTISFAQTLKTKAETGLQTMAYSTGGFYAYAPNGTALEEIYRKIAEELKTYAGVNTTMHLDFNEIDYYYEDATGRATGNETFAYSFIPGHSTAVTSWKAVDGERVTVSEDLPVPPYPADAMPAPQNNTIRYPYTLDQSGEWQENRLYFYVGNIRLNQTWQATFRLVPIAQNIIGNINIFGPNSSVTFEGAEGQYTTNIPDTFVTVIGSIIRETLTQPLVDVEITSLSGAGLVDLDWSLNYKGFTPGEEIEWTIGYCLQESIQSCEPEPSGVGGHERVSAETGVLYMKTSVDIRDKTSGRMFRVVDCSTDIPEEKKAHIVFKITAYKYPDGLEDSDSRAACIEYLPGILIR